MPQTPPATVIVAEDDSVHRHMYTDLLTRAGYRVMSATNGEDTLAMIRSHHVDVAVVDIAMPGMNGWSLVRELRADKSLANLRIIVVTGLLEAFDRAASLAAGADSHFTKPIDPEQLLNEIARVLNK